MNEIPLAEYRQQIERAIADGRYNEAVAHGKHILERYPKDIETYWLLGQAMLEAGQDQQAAEMFQRVLSADPERLTAWVALAQIAEREGDLEAAIGNQERAFELASDNDDVARALRRLHREWEGREPKRLQLTPEALARLYLRGDLLSRAVTELRKLLEDNPDRVDLRVALAEALWRSGRRGEAAAVCQEILDQQPDNLKANLILGEIWTSNGREEGLLYLERAEALDPENRVAQEFFEASSPLPAWEPHITPAEVDIDTAAEDQTALMETQELLSGEGTIVMALPGAPTSAEPVPAWLQEIAEKAAEVAPAAEPPEPELVEEQPPAPAEHLVEPTPPEGQLEPLSPEDHTEPAPAEDLVEPASPEDQLEPASPEDQLEPPAPELRAEPPSPEDYVQPAPPDDHTERASAEDFVEPAPVPEEAAAEGVDDQEPLAWLAELAGEETAAEEPDEPVPHEPPDEISVPVAEAGVEPAEAEPDVEAGLIDADEPDAEEFDDDEFDAEKFDADDFDDDGFAADELDDELERDDGPEGLHPADIPDWLQELAPADRVVASGPGPEALAALLNGETFTPLDLEDDLDLQTALESEGLTSGDDVLAWLEALSQEETAELHAQTEAEREAHGDAIADGPPPPSGDAFDAPAVPPTAPPADELDADETLAEVEPPPAPDEAAAFDEWDESAELRAQTEAEREARTDAIADGPPPPTGDAFDAPAVPPTPPPADELDADETLAEVEPPPAPDEAAAFDDWDGRAELPAWLEGTVPEFDEPVTEVEAVIAAAAGAPFEDWDDTTELADWLDVGDLPSQEDALSWLEKLGEEAEAADLEQALTPEAEAEAVDEEPVLEAEPEAIEEEIAPEVEAEEVTEEPTPEAEPADVEEEIAPAVELAALEEALAPEAEGEDVAALKEAALHEEPAAELADEPAEEAAFGWTAFAEATQPAAVEALEEPPPEGREVEPIEPPVAPGETAPAVVEPDVEREELAAEVETVALAPEVEEAPAEDLQGFVERRRRYVEEHPDDHEARLGLGRLLWQADNRDEAIKTYDTLIRQGAPLDEIIPDLEDYASQWSHPSVQQALGDAYARADRLQDALDVYRKALKSL